MKNIGFNTVHELDMINRLAKDDPLGFIARCEEHYEKTINEVSAELSGYGGRTVALLSGPSGSGKTTSANKIAAELERSGKQAITISLDNFYRGRDEAPLLPDGSRDYESIYALNIPVLQECLSDIMITGSCMMPKFDFSVGAPKKERINVTLKDEGVLILEGIHALNPMLVGALEEIQGINILKLYVSIGEGITYGDKTVVTPRELRLMRRITRDFSHRASSPQNTLHLWTNVIAGEDKYIAPYMGTADLNINTLHPYEPCVFAENTLPLLEKVNKGDENYETAMHILDFLRKITPISEDNIPETSLLNEFIVIESRL